MVVATAIIMFRLRLQSDREIPYFKLIAYHESIIYRTGYRAKVKSVGKKLPC